MTTLPAKQGAVLIAGMASFPRNQESREAGMGRIGPHPVCAAEPGQRDRGLRAPGGRAQSTLPLGEFLLALVTRNSSLPRGWRVPFIPGADVL